MNDILRYIKEKIRKHLGFFQNNEKYVLPFYLRVNQIKLENISEAWRKKGAKVGKNVRIIGMLDPVNPHRITIGDNTIIGKQSGILTHGPVSGGRPVVIGSNVFIGFNVTVLPGAIIGDNCIIGAGSVVSGNIPKNSIAVGNPAIVIKKRDFEELNSYIMAIQNGKYIGAVGIDGENGEV